MARLRQIIINAVKAFLAEDAMSQAAAVAFYTALSFAPLVLLLLTFGGMLGESAGRDVVRFFGKQIGPSAATITESVVDNVDSNDRSWWRWVVSIGVLLFTASAVFAQLQSSLNRVWGVEGDTANGLLGLIRKRLLSMGMIFALLFILLVALIVSAVMDQLLPDGAAFLGRAASFIVSLLVVTLLFASIFKFLPDVHLPWRYVWLGSFITALLFTLGKFGLSLYFAYGDIGRGYDTAAASLIALLVWVYYSCIIFFFGAEVMQQVVRAQGARLKPSEHARYTDEDTKRDRAGAAS